MILTYGRRQHLWVAGAIGLLALVVRLLFVAFYPVNPLAGGDPTAFWSFAQGIAAGNGFRSTFEPWIADRPPLYSYFLATIFLLIGESRTGVFVIQSLLGAVAGGLFFLSCRQIMGEVRGLVAAVMFALLPHFLLFTKQILTEALYVPLFVMLLALLFVPTSGMGFTIGKWIGAGALLGLLALARREALFPSGVVALLMAWLQVRPAPQRWLAACFIMAATAGMVLLPWLIRNQLLLGSPILSSSTGWNLIVGNSPGATGGYTELPASWQLQFVGLGEMARDSKAWELVLGWIRSDPGAFLRLLPLKLAALWGPAHNFVLDATDVLLIPFLLLGLARLSQKQDSWERVAAVAIPAVLCVSLIAMVFVGGWRYRIGAYPGLLILAAYGIPDSIKFPRWVPLHPEYGTK